MGGARRRQFNLTIDPPLRRSAKVFADRRDMSLSDWICEAIKDKMQMAERGLADADIARLERYRSLLVRAGDDEELKSAIDGSLAVFTRLLESNLEL